MYETCLTFGLPTDIACQRRADALLARRHRVRTGPLRPLPRKEEHLLTHARPARQHLSLERLELAQEALVEASVGGVEGECSGGVWVGGEVGFSEGGSGRGAREGRLGKGG